MQSLLCKKRIENLKILYPFLGFAGLLLYRRHPFAVSFLIFGIQFVQMPMPRIFEDVVFVFAVVLKVADYVVVKMALPNVCTVFLIAKPFKCRNNVGQHFICRGRRSCCGFGHVRDLKAI